MEQTAIHIREGGFASLFYHGRQYRRELDKNSRPRWSRRTSNGFLPVSEQRARRLERMFRHPEKLKRVQLFPRYKADESPVPIKDFFEIPLTTTLPKQKVQWLVTGLIPKSEVILITGLPASFKSFLVQALAAAVSEGCDFLGRTTKQTAVLLLDRDNPLHIITQRLEMLHISQGDHFRVWGNWVGDIPPEIGDPRLEEIAKNHHPLIIFDSFVRFHDADENSAKEMAVVMAELRKLVTAGATVIVIHHSPKQNPKASRKEKQKPSYRGSSDIYAGVDVAFSLSVNRETSPPVLTLECFKQRAIEEFTITIRPDLEHGRFEVIADTTVLESTKLTERLKALINAQPGLNQKELRKRSGIPEEKLRRILNAGENIHWRCERSNRKEKSYYLLQIA